MWHYNSPVIVSTSSYDFFSLSDASVVVKEENWTTENSIAMVCEKHRTKYKTIW